jgi:hypothetical protein
VQELNFCGFLQSVEHITHVNVFANTVTMGALEIHVSLLICKCALCDGSRTLALFAVPRFVIQLAAALLVVADTPELTRMLLVTGSAATTSAT